MSLAVLADHLARKGRDGDSMLVHMTPGEVKGLQALALAHGGSLTINPETGLVEAGFLKSLLPAIAGFALNFIAPGIGTAIGSALGTSAAVGTGIAVGGITGLATGSLSKGIMAGLGAYGGAGLAGGLAGAGESSFLAAGAGDAAAAGEAARQGAYLGGESGAALEAARQQGVQSFMTDRAAQFSRLPFNQQLTQGFGALKDQGGLGSLFRPAMAAAAPMLADQSVIAGLPQTATSMGKIRPQSFDPYTQQYTSRGVYDADKFPGFEAIPRAAGGTVRMAEGGDTGQEMPIGVDMLRRLQELQNPGYMQRRMAEMGMPIPQDASAQAAIPAAPQQADTPPPAAFSQADATPLASPPQATTPPPQRQYTSGSQQAYDYLFGRAPYPVKPFIQGGGPIMRPYAEAVLGMPTDTTKQRYIWNANTQQYDLNPAYVPYKSVIEKAKEEAEKAQAAGLPVPGYMDYSGSGADGAATGGGGATGEGAGGIGSTGVGTSAGIGGEGGPGGVKKGGIIRKNMGGITALAGGGMQYNLGGYSDGGRLLRGPGDGVSDSIPATIGQKQPARLADGEFVVPARIVSELGNGSTEAGARKLYAMMDRVQKARGRTTGKNRVAVDSKAERLLPA